MDKPPTKAKRKPKRAKPPEEPDADLRRVLLRAAETCQDRFEQKPTRLAYHLSRILEALEHDPRLIDPVYKKIQSIRAARAAASGVPRVTAIGGVPVLRLAEKNGEPIEDENGMLVYQRVPGRPWEGPGMVATTRWAIAVSDADPLDTAALVMEHFPPLWKADCPKWAETNAERVGLAIADLLPDEDFRSEMIDRRLASQATNVDYERLAAHAEQCDRANEDLLDLPQWKKKKIPEKVLRAILRELGHPAPDNLT